MPRMPASGIQAAFRVVLRTVLPCAALLATWGCVAAVDNDAQGLGGNGDRWYTAGLRLQHDVPVEAPEGGRPWFDEATLAVTGLLELLPAGEDDGRPVFTTSSLVGGQQIFTPEDIETAAPVKDDRPYAGWLYAGVVRFDTWLDPDAFTRRDVEHAVELDLGVVGPNAYGENAQSAAHQIFPSDEVNGWSNQLGNELGIVLRATRSSRDAYAGELTDGDLAFDAISQVGGALGNVDTHAGIGETLRLGWNLPRSFDLAGGDRRRLLPGAARTEDEAASLYAFAGLTGRLVLHDIFLDGNTFRDSQSIDKETWVGSASVGVAWEWSSFRLAYSLTQLSKEYEGQPDDQVYASITLGWVRSF